jgi:quinol monooxygenase YgiN
VSTTVLTELNAQPGRGDDVAELLLKILGESLEHDGCEIIRIIRDQDHPDRVAGLTQWTARHQYDDYLAWRTAKGFTDTFEAMLTGPLVIHYYDELYYGEGNAYPGH